MVLLWEPEQQWQGHPLALEQLLQALLLVLVPL